MSPPLILAGTRHSDGWTPVRDQVAPDLGSFPRAGRISVISPHQSAAPCCWGVASHAKITASSAAAPTRRKLTRSFAATVEGVPSRFGDLSMLKTASQEGDQRTRRRMPKDGSLSPSQLGSFSTMTEDAMIHLLGYLSANEVIVSSGICRSMLSYATHEHVWHDLCLLRVAQILSSRVVYPVGRYTWLPPLVSAPPAGDLVEDEAAASVSSEATGLASLSSSSPAASLPAPPSSSSSSSSSVSGRSTPGMDASTTSTSSSGTLEPASGSPPSPKEDWKPSLASLATTPTSFRRSDPPREALARLVHCLALPTWQLLFASLRWVSLVGMWRREPVDLRSDYRGELLGMQLKADGELGADTIFPDGSRQPRFLVRFRRHPRFKRALDVEVTSPSSPKMCLRVDDSPAWRVATRQFSLEVPGTEAGEALSFHRLGPCFARSPVTRPQVGPDGRNGFQVLGEHIGAGDLDSMDIDILSLPRHTESPAPVVSPQGTPSVALPPVLGLQGLWVAPYGSHGLEIVYLRHQDQVSGDRRASGLVDGSRLEGLKVVGDANVPASQLSFAVNMTQTYNPTDRLAMDHRLVVAFPPEGAVIADLNIRRDNIVAWYRGLGQINRIQGVWEPDWVGIDFLVYGSGPVGFSVLWDEQGEVIRHIIDFVRLPLE